MALTLEPPGDKSRPQSRLACRVASDGVQVQSMDSSGGTSERVQSRASGCTRTRSLCSDSARAAR